MSDTPITDKARTKATELAGLSAWVLASDMRALELAANGLRDAVKSIMHEDGGTISLAGGNPKCVAVMDALAAFAALQPSPHDAPRTL